MSLESKNYLILHNILMETEIKTTAVNSKKSTLKEALKISSLPVVFASLCCLSPIILVLLGLSTVSFASSLANTLYGDYTWYFRGAGLVLLAVAIIFYLRHTKGICTLDDAKKHRNEIINIVLISLIAAVIGYVFFLYVVLHYIGVFLKLWT